MTPETLLELQHVDTAIDQLRNRLTRLPEAAAERAAHAAVTAWEQQQSTLLAEIAALEAAIAASEKESETISHHRQRLEGQLKTVTAVREVEALMHEIERLTNQRSALDDGELESMDAVAAAEASLVEHLEQEAAVRQAAADATTLADQARADAKTEQARLAAQALALRAGLESSMLAMYDTMRPQHSGIAIAKLNGLRCEGCHLDLSRAEVDQMKAAPASDMPECPNCGRLLVR